MPRLSNEEKIFIFHPKKYLAGLTKAVKPVVKQLRTALIEEIQRQLEDLDYKTEPVYMADGRVTSDYKRRGALLRSIKDYAIEHVVGESLHTAVSAMEKNFKDSHIGFYYEYGTGENTVDEAPYPAWEHRNKYRPPGIAAPIVSRSRFAGTIRGVGGGGFWLDAGGNLRQTSSFTGGRTKEESPSFYEAVGDDVEASYWFATAVDIINKKPIKSLGSKTASQLIISAIKHVPVTSHEFWTYRKHYQLGVD